MELGEALLRESKLRTDLDTTQEKLEDQTERADEAEDHLYALRAQNDQFKDRVALREATIETEANEYFDLAASASMMESDMSKRVESVVPLLMKLVMSTEVNVVKDAAKVMQGLGVMTAEGMQEHLENVTMLKEEMVQREGEVREVKRNRLGRGRVATNTASCSRRRRLRTSRGLRRPRGRRVERAMRGRRRLAGPRRPPQRARRKRRVEEEGWEGSERSCERKYLLLY